MTVRQLIVRLQSIPAKTEMYSKAQHRLYRVAKARTLLRELTILSDREKDSVEFATRFDGRVSYWLASSIGSKEELLERG